MEKMFFVVYSKPSCPYCELAKTLLKQKGIEFTVVHLDVGQPQVDGEEYISREELLTRIPETARTMPQIYDKEEYIGGFMELKKYLDAIA